MDFTDLTTVKAWASVTAATDDALLTSLIEATTAAMQEYMGRLIFTTAYVERYNGTGTPRLPLRATPVTGVAQLKVYGQVLQAAASPLEAGYLFDDLGIYLTPGTIVAAGAYGGVEAVFPRVPQVIEITYTAGYATAPKDLKDAATRQVVFEYRGRTREGEASKSLGPSMTVSYLTQAWHPRTLEVLERYKRRQPV